MSYPDLLAGRPLPPLDPDEIVRYGRHLTLPEVGPSGQQRLKAARVLMVGAGGLGSPIALYLAAAGVGTLGVIDGDRVEASNLQRQLLYGHSDIGRPKVAAARDRLADINHHIQIDTYPERFDADNALALVDAYDLVVDGSDNFPTRYLVNDACARAGKPNVWGAIQRFEGQVSVFWAQEGPCYRCLFPEPPPPGLVPSCAEAGVLGVLPGMIGVLQANEVIKLLLGNGKPLVGRLLIIDALSLRIREVTIARCDRFPDCTEDHPLVSTAAGCASPTAIPSPQTISKDPAMAQTPGTAPHDVPLEIRVEALQAMRQADQPHHLMDVREPHEHARARIEGAQLVPLRSLPEQVDHLNPEQLIVVHCHHGPRSMQAVLWLRQQGFHRATNLAGGIHEWSLSIDPSVPQY